MKRSIGHYRLLELLGQGGMGEVFLAEDEQLGRRVALKVLPDTLSRTPERLERFRREARAVAALNHPNIVTLFSIDEVDGVHFQTMEYVRGTTLTEVLARGGLALESFLSIARALAEALAAAHGEGVTHRDLKPSNIMIGEEGSTKVLDFGLAKFHRETEVQDPDAPTELLTTEGTLLGTVAYMSPEQVQGLPADPRSDIFALGVILYEMATGSHPFPGSSNADRMVGILRDEPRPVYELAPGFPGHVSQLIGECLRKRADERIQSAAELSGLLHREPHPARQGLRSDPDLTSIAVLPFADLSAEKDQEFFCDGMTEELINALAQMADLKVAARSSSFRYKGSQEDVRRIGGQLGVSAVLEGGVRKAGERLRITLQLINVADGHDLWAERFDREMADVFEIQDDIARRVVGSLKLELGGSEKLVSPQTTDVDAYNLYLRGRHHLNKRTEGDLRRSIEPFEAAIAIDPEFGRARAGLADAHTLLGIYGAEPPAVVMPKARVAAEEALRVDGSLAEAHTSLGCVQSIYDWSWIAGEGSFQRAIELEPTYATARHWYAMNNLLPQGRFDAALAELDAALDIDPLSPVICASIGLTHGFAGRHSESVKALEEAQGLEFHYAVASFFLGCTLADLGRYDAAIREIERAIELSSATAEMVAALGYAHALAGNHVQARQVIEELETRSEHSFVSPALIAQVHSGLGEIEPALGLLESALQQRAVDLAWAAVRPTLRNLRGEPRFDALLDRMNLAPADG